MASQSKSWKQCRPANGAEFDGDLDAVDGSKTAERRPVMEAYLQYLVPENASSLGMVHMAVEKLAFKTWAKQEVNGVGDETSEFVIDQVVWGKYLKTLPKDQFPSFPWPDIVAEDMPKYPASAKYEQHLAATTAGSAKAPVTSEASTAVAEAESKAREDKLNEQIAKLELSLRRAESGVEAAAWEFKDTVARVMVQFRSEIQNLMMEESVQSGLPGVDAEEKSVEGSDVIIRDLTAQVHALNREIKEIKRGLGKAMTARKRSIDDLSNDEQDPVAESVDISAGVDTSAGKTRSKRPRLDSP